jgi:hypothetical protein
VIKHDGEPTFAMSKQLGLQSAGSWQFESMASSREKFCKYSEMLLMFGCLKCFVMT